MNALNKALQFSSQGLIQVRTNMGFADQAMPKYWMENDPFKTRIADALQMTFPVGERYFIESVRAFRDQITDQALQEAVTDFIKQEAQHGIEHELINDLLRAQGMPIDDMVVVLKRILGNATKRYSNEFNLAHTAATEHLTALMAKCFFEKKEVMQGAHPSMRALLAWHAIEEMEHRAVCYDVLKHTTDISEAKRWTAMLLVAVLLPINTLIRAAIMLRADGYSRLQILRMTAKGMPWLFGKEGILTAVSDEFLAWFKRDFHPDNFPMLHSYPTWLEVYEKTGDPLVAGEALWAAGH